jgi:hypothetical protein
VVIEALVLVAIVVGINVPIAVWSVRSSPLYRR